MGGYLEILTAASASSAGRSVVNRPLRGSYLVCIAERTSIRDMREDNTHGAGIHHPLDETIAALVGHPDEGSDANRQSRTAQVARVVEGESRVLQLDKDTIVARIFGELHDLRVRHQSYAKCLKGDAQSAMCARFASVLRSEQ